ncbi:Thioredoxin reductase [Candidatus Annandia adelgestsuga]|uniref:Thioredoxin reductase n=1 Tax=Candidatus Annandia adelgestsuga TaxID=1302411 RepID=A0A3Q9CKM1_9ENTR|nr:thioredoxin-disulfide reductase [Candidatus Annandia adelgestsuga]AZP36161.1 Thioredoxin reductase [Candidatus Annandia adelgestsuga]
MIKTKLIILGSGPAGYTAAIYASRANLYPILITGLEKGGQLTKTLKIENWPGDYKNITGNDLMNRMYIHAKKFNTNIIFDNIYKVDLKNYPFRLIGDYNEYYSDSLIISTGSSPKYLEIKSEEKFKGKGLSTCATCDGYFYRNKTVAIVGGGNKAIEEALYLSNIVKKIHIIHRNNIFKAEKILLNQLKNKIIDNKVIIHTDFFLKEIIGNDKNIKSINICYNKNKKIIKKIKVSGVFISIGHKPNTYLFKNQLKLKNNYIYIKKNKIYSTQTSIPGVFAAGDVIDKNYKQAITAAGSGCMSAIDAIKYINSIKKK